MATWLVRDDFDGDAQIVPEYRVFPTQVGVSGADTYSYGNGGDAPEDVRLVLDGAGGLTLDPETFARYMWLDVLIPDAPAGPVEVTFSVRLRPSRYGYSPLRDGMQVYFGGPSFRVVPWNFNGSAWIHSVQNTEGDWLPSVPATTGPVVDAGGVVTVTLAFLEGFITVSDGTVVATIPTGFPPRDGGPVGFRFSLMDMFSVDYLQVSGVGSGPAPKFWTNFVNTYEVP